MIKRIHLIITFTGIMLASLAAQNTVGLLSYEPSKSFDGYNLIYPHNQANVYLLDNCGEIAHMWADDPSFRPGNIAYLLENGNLLKGKRPASVTADAIWAGGGGATMEIRDWDNNLLWEMTLNDSLHRFHHDMAPMPNGNFLAIVWELKTMEEAIQAGRDTALISEGELWPDYIIEVDPDTDEIVWEWHAWDHLIQDHDPSKDNYGVVGDQPGLIDVNWDTSDGAADWMHGNAIDYLPGLDQIVLSVPTFNEIWIIDHTTTTQEAAGHTGGLSGKGGDLIYRWGNPAAYRAGTVDDQKLYFQHNIHWIDDFLTITHPYFGKMGVFNNRVGADFSTANVFSPAFDMYNWAYPMNGDVWGPADFDLTITHPEPTRLYSTGLSSVQFLPNGNTLICSGRYGYAFELTPQDEIVWEYVTPLVTGAPVSQGDTLQVNNNLTFRMKRYPTNYSAFDGKDLSSQGYIELNPNTEFCDSILPVFDLINDYALKIYPNPAIDRVTFEWQGMPRSELYIFNLLGQQMAYVKSSGGREYMDTSDWEEGIYFVQIDGKTVKKLVLVK